MAHDKNEDKQDISRERMEHVISGLRNFIVRDEMGAKKSSVTLEDIQKNLMMDYHVLLIWKD